MFQPIIDPIARDRRRHADQTMRQIVKWSGAEDRKAAAQAKRDRKNAKRAAIVARAYRFELV